MLATAIMIACSIPFITIFIAAIVSAFRLEGMELPLMTMLLAMLKGTCTMIAVLLFISGIMIGKNLESTGGNMISTYDDIKNMSVSLYDLNGIHAAYIDLRIDRSTLPDDVHAYDVREGEYYLGSVEDHVLVNHSGTVLTREPLHMLHPEESVYIYLDDDDEPWSSLDAAGSVTLENFIKGNYTLRE